MKSLYSHIPGNDEVKDYLTRILEKGTVPQSFLFAGERLQEISLFAQVFASAVSSPADIHQYAPEGKVGLHSIETMRRFSDEVYMQPFNSERKVFIIHDADRMLPTSANALLKTFEEPAKSSIIILTTKRPTGLLPTILSRCTTVRFQGRQNPVFSEVMIKYLVQGKFKTYHDLKEAAAEIAKLIEEPAEAKRAELVSNEADEKEVDGIIAMQTSLEAKELFHTILSWYRDMHLLQAKGDRLYLMHPMYEEQLLQSKILPLETVEKILADAKLSLERFTPLNMVLERIFLTLDQ
jgi:DNA polymerase-3 subunit delta'